MLKKFAAILMAALLAFSLCACGREPAPEPGTPGNSVSEAETSQQESAAALENEPESDIEIPLEGEYFTLKSSTPMGVVLEALEFDDRVIVCHGGAAEQMGIKAYDKTTGEELFEIPVPALDGSYHREMLKCDWEPGYDFCMILSGTVVYFDSMNEKEPLEVPIPDEVLAENEYHADFNGESYIWINDEGVMLMPKGGEAELILDNASIKTEFYKKLGEFPFESYAPPEESLGENLGFHDCRFVCGGKKVAAEFYDDHALYFGMVVYDIETGAAETGCSYTEMESVSYIGGDGVKNKYIRIGNASGVRLINTEDASHSDYPYVADYNSGWLSGTSENFAEAEYENFNDCTGLKLYANKNGERELLVSATDMDAMIFVEATTENYVFIEGFKGEEIWVCMVKCT
ncbi:MAG: hypothetical protein ACI4IW_08215 [Oscillospiraceae bacterium]